MSDSKQKFHEYLEDVINASNIKQLDMAERLGFAKPNIITMFKQGKTKVPLEKIPSFAKVLNLDPKMLLTMLEYCPALFKVMQENFGEILTKNEKHILYELRRLTNNSDPAMTSIRHIEAFDLFTKELMR
jgi:transcriptional regulator with XRE-family HTH domain